MSEEQEALLHVDRFLTKAGIEFSFLEQQQNDPPDFVLTIADQRVYLEHTLLFTENGSHLSARKKTITEILHISRDTYFDSFKKASDVNITFSETPALKGSEKNRVVKAIVELIDKYCPTKAEKYKRVPQAVLPPQIQNIEIYVPVNNEEPHWMLEEDVRFLGTIREKEIIHRIEDKNLRAIEVMGSRQYDVYWLFFGILGNEVSGFYDLEVPFLKWHNDWVFSRIILFDCFHNSFKIIDRQ